MIFRFFRKDPRRALIETLYDRIAAASRRPPLYVDLGIPDTIEGRFESVVLHAILVLRRLRDLPSPAGEVAQELVDCVFRRLENSLREMGIGDMGVPKRMKKLGHAFYGRADAYDRALDAGDRDALAAALGRNALGQEEPAPRLADYVLACAQDLRDQDLDALLNRGPVLPAPERF